MAKIISIANQKGGVGKTSTAVNLVTALSAVERKILLIDMDPQGNATTGFGIDKSTIGMTVYDMLINGTDFSQIKRAVYPPFLDLIPATPDLSGAEVELAGEKDRAVRLKEQLIGSQDDYDYIFIDCPPSLGLLTLNALVAADEVLIPLQTEFYALEGLSQLSRTVEIAKQQLNPELKISGIVLTMYDKRNNLSANVEEEVRSYYPELVYETVIPRNVRVSEAPSFGKPVLWYDIRSTGAQAYIQMATEFLEREEC